MSTSFTIGYYRYTPHLHSVSPALIGSIPYDLILTIKSYDDMLHQSLNEIIRKGCFSSTSQIKNFKSILEREPIVSKCFSQNELKKFSLLWISILAGYWKSAELLIRSGANVNDTFGRRYPQVIDKKWTILYVLLHMDPTLENKRLVSLIMNHGVDLQARDSYGQTALHFAAMNKRVQMTEWFLERGADVNATNKFGVTPCLLAISGYWPTDDVLALFIKHGADVLVKDRDGCNALHYVARVLDVSCQHTELSTRTLIQKGVSLHDRDCQGLQPIHLAIEKGNYGLVKILLDLGADVNVKRNGETLLYFAIKYCLKARSKEIVETLLERGAKVNIKTFEGHYTPLHRICMESSHRTMMQMRVNFAPSVEGIIEILLNAGADVLAEDLDGKTPLAHIFAYSNENNMESVEVPGVLQIIKALAQRKARRPMIELKDEMIIERYPRLWDYYQRCIKEIDKMRSARFIETCTLFNLLTKREYDISVLMHNPEFVPKFKLCSLGIFSEFPIYAGDLIQAFKRVERYFDSMLEQEVIVNEAVPYTLPYLVVRNIVRYILDE